jgi:DNA-binding NtrC family response regulator
MARILIIDDSPIYLQFLGGVLAAAGHEVREAGSGSVGLALIAAYPAEVVISDIIMPDMDGIEVLLEVRKRSPRTRLILISGGGRHVQAGDVLRVGNSLGAWAVLSKPLTPEALLAAVNSALAPGSPAPSRVPR